MKVKDGAAGRKTRKVETYPRFSLVSQLWDMGIAEYVVQMKVFLKQAAEIKRC